MSSTTVTNELFDALAELVDANRALAEAEKNRGNCSVRRWTCANEGYARRRSWGDKLADCVKPSGFDRWRKLVGTPHQPDPADRVLVALHGLTTVVSKLPAGIASVDALRAELRIAANQPAFRVRGLSGPESDAVNAVFDRKPPYTMELEGRFSPIAEAVLSRLTDGGSRRGRPTTASEARQKGLADGDTGGAPSGGRTPP